MIDAPDSVLGHRLGFLNERARVACLFCAREALGPALFSGCAVCGVAAPLTLVYQPGTPDGSRTCRGHHGSSPTLRSLRADGRSLLPTADAT